jgi:all-trans-8'-apo-beta-carotenal 15,15'-oxygenase
MDGAQVVVNAYRPVSGELDGELRLAEGERPPGLRGVLFRNGPGRLEVHGTPQMHPFDGDGMVCRFEFGEDGRVYYKNRWVRTEEFVREEQAGRMLFRNFGTNLPGGLWKNGLRLKFKNAANTSVVMHGGKLLALWEAGLPHRLDPHTLATEARDDFEGALLNRRGPPSSWISRELPFSAHPKVCPRTGELFNFGLQIGPSPDLVIYRVDHAGVVRSIARVPLEQASFMHDFVITERHLVFFASPIHFDLARALSGLTTPVEAIRRREDESTEILVVPRDFHGDPSRRTPPDVSVDRFRAPSGFFLFHFFNAYEDSSGELVVDGCRMARFEGGTVDLRDPESVRSVPFDPAYPTRWRIDPRTKSVSESRLTDVPMELPFVDRRRVGRPHRIGWGTVRSEQSGTPVHTAVGRLDMGTGQVVQRELAPDLPGELVFVPLSDTADEDEGVLLSVVYRAESHTSELWALDPRDLRTMARWELPQHLPPGFHGWFVPSGANRTVTATED